MGTWRWNSSIYWDTDARPNDATGLFMTSPSGSEIITDGCEIYDNNGQDYPGNCWTADMDTGGIAHEYQDVYYSGTNNYIGDEGLAWMWLSSPSTNSYIKFSYEHNYNHLWCNT